MHDIGKLGYRAGLSGTHEEIGKNFIAQYEDILGDISGLISMHHNFGNIFNQDGYRPLKTLIIADWLASAERIGIKKSTDVRKIGLTPIFSKISLYNNNKINQKFSYLGEKLSLKEDSNEIFPKINSKITDLLENNFSENWESFKEKFRKIRQYQGNEFEFLFSLLNQHFKFIPSAAYKVEPDISLFDHSKMVCALSVAFDNYFKLKAINENDIIQDLNLMGKILLELYDKGSENVEVIKSDEKKRELFSERKCFNIVMGDFSGIQNFIHSIYSKYAMKTLKGRSFYISLLTEVIVQYIVRELSLTEANIIFAGGGHFYIISHDFEGFKEQINEISIKTNKFFIEYFNSNLYLALDYVQLSIEDILFKISNIWKQVNEKIVLEKNKKFIDLLKGKSEEYFIEVFGPNKQAGEKLERCIVCNSFEALEPISEEKSEEKWCPQCQSFGSLIRDIKNAKFIRNIQNDETYNKILNEFNAAIEFSQSIVGEKTKYYSINSPTTDNTIGDKLLSIGLPIDKDGRIIDLDTFADLAQERTGYRKIGVVKMDVDSLGKIFQRGLGENYSISRVSTLSSSLTLFFKGYISKLVEKEFPDSIYLIFSGGDDVFAVGSWDKLIEFSYKLYRDFREFTAFNPDITLSAAIFIEAPRFPIIRASLYAESELERAKNFEPYNKNINTKNKISIFGSILKWDWTLEKEDEYQKILQNNKEIEGYIRDQILDLMKIKDNIEKMEILSNWINKKSEFELAIILKDILVYLIREKNFSKSMLQKIERSIKEMRYLLEDSLERKINVPKLWRLKYYLRTVLSSKEQEVKLLSNFFVLMFEIIVKNNLFEKNSSLQIKNIEFISVAVKWADYLTRKRK